MPGKHHANTQLVGSYVERELIDAIDEARGIESRSDFLRDALVELAQRRGIPVPDTYRRAPDRAGKGGPIKYKLGRKRKDP